jgi:hypothetical protein
MSADARCETAVPWDDLVPDVREDILARVPLLRLAQLAVQCREFRAAYRKRLDAQRRMEPPLLCPIVPPVNPGFWRKLSFHIICRRIDRWPWIHPCSPSGYYRPVIQLPCEEGLQWRMPQILRTSFHFGLISMPVYCYYRTHDSHNQGMAHAVVVLRCSLKLGFTSLLVVSMEVRLDCSYMPVGDPPSVNILLGLRLVPACRIYLDSLTGGVPDGLHRRGPEARPIDRIRLMLPRGSAWRPDVLGGEQLCDALTSLAALAGCRPLAVKICVKGAGQDAHAFRLPCVVPA